MVKKLDGSRSKQRFQKGVSTVLGIPAGHDDTKRLAVALQNFTDALFTNSLQFIEGINEILAMLEHIMPGSDRVKTADKLNTAQSLLLFQVGMSMVLQIRTGHDDAIRLGAAMQDFTDALLTNDLQLIKGINDILARLEVLDIYFALGALEQQVERRRRLIDLIARS